MDRSVKVIDWARTITWAILIVALVFVIFVFTQTQVVESVGPVLCEESCP